jgi:capsular polysaccharide biosynthesis protein
MGLTRYRVSLVVAVLLAAALLGIGIPWARSQPLSWTSRASLLILPARDSTLPADQLAAFYDTLASGQIPQTYAEVIRSSNVVGRAEDDLSLSPALRQAVTVDTEVVPNTSVVQIAVTGPQPQLVQNVAFRVVGEAGGETDVLGTPFTTTIIGSGASPAQLAGLGATKLLALIILGTAVVAVGVQQLIQRAFVPTQPTPAGPSAEHAAPRGTGIPRAKGRAATARH